jgi:hypothetical protein
MQVVGRKFGRLKVLRRLPASRVLAACACGSKPRKYQLGHLVHGHTRSCSCLQRKRAAQVCKARQTKHGHSTAKTGEYVAWVNMKRRCDDPKHNPSFKNYGGKGVRVCDRWLGVHGFQNFLADLGFKPTPKHTLSRRGDSGNYEPGNCAWETWAEQGEQRRLKHQKAA